MTNILLHEWDQWLAETAALFGAKNGARVENHGAHWESPMGSVSLLLSLTGDCSGRFMIPQLSIGSSSSLPGDPLLALAHLRASEETIHAAVRALAMVERLRVYLADCPCDSCSGRGYEYRNPSKACTYCDGTGVRNDNGRDRAEEE